MTRLREKLRTTFSRLVLEWGVSPRYLTDTALSFKIVSIGRQRKTSQAIKGRAYDLSESGLSILSNQVAADGLHLYFSNDMTGITQLEIELELPQKTISILGQTCRYQKLETASLSQYSYLLGVKIIEIAEEYRSIYQKYLTELKRDPARRSPHY